MLVPARQGLKPVSSLNKRQKESLTMCLARSRGPSKFLVDQCSRDQHEGQEDIQGQVGHDVDRVSLN